MITKLRYLQEGNNFAATARVVACEKREDGKDSVQLDQTLFYAQGGGQPFDIGSMLHGKVLFRVDEVRFDHGIVHHIGRFEHGLFVPGDEVEIAVDKQRRLLHSKIHTAGHLVDIALFSIGKNLMPAKGYHFPDGPYVEYEGVLDDEEKELLKKDISAAIKELVDQGLPVTVDFVSYNQLQRLCRFVPQNIPQDKPIRTMTVHGCDAIPCGGTHVTNTREVDGVTIRSIKSKKGKTKIQITIQSDET